MECVKRTYDFIGSLNKLKLRMLAAMDDSSCNDVSSATSEEADTTHAESLNNNCHCNKRKFMNCMLSKKINGISVKSNGAVHIDNSYYYKNLNCDIVASIEKDLEFFEIVSIVFLVYDDSQLEFALQRLVIAIKNDNCSNVITDWCRIEPEYWRQKLIQSLSIIKNYQVLKKLGFNVDKVNEIRKNYIFSGRKKLYYFFESLTIEENKCLIDHVNRDFKQRDIVMEGIDVDVFDPLYLELSFLLWLSRKYISFYKDNFDLLPLIKSISNVKQLTSVRLKLETINNEISEWRKRYTSNSYTKDNIRKETRRKHFNKRKIIPVVINSQIINPENDDFNIEATSQCEKGEAVVGLVNASDSTGGDASHSISPHTGISNISPFYPTTGYYEVVDPANTGLCIIINQKNFKNRETNPDYLGLMSSKRLPDRDGTENDVNTILNTFKGLKYTVMRCDDLSHIEMINSIVNLVNENFLQSVHSSLFIFILTHGYEGHVYGSNSVGVAINTIIKKLLYYCEILVGKPKAIIIQACQGAVPQRVIVPDGDDEEREPVGKLIGECDLFLGMATVPGYVAFRHREEGTWFIQTLCHCIRMFADKRDFVKIFTNVNDELSKKRVVDGSGSWMGQVSEFRSSLRSEWYLVPPKYK